MPIEDDGYKKLTEEEIKEQLKESLNSSLPVSATPGNLVTSQLEAEAQVLAQNQEEALKRVYEAAYLEDATGGHLDKLVEIIGLSRREAKPATGIARFSRATMPLSTYTIPRGTEIQTAGTNPVSFTTQEPTNIKLISSFETTRWDSEWNGDTDDCKQRSDKSVPTNDYLAMEPGATIEYEDKFKIGKRFGAILSYDEDNIGTERIRVQKNADNYIELTIDWPSNVVFEVRVDGIVEKSKLGSISGYSSNYIYIEIDWTSNEGITLTVHDTRNKDNKFQEINFDKKTPWNSSHFVADSASGFNYVASVATLATTANIEAVDGGVDSNVGKNSIVFTKSNIVGINDVRNPVPTGNPDYVNVDSQPLIAGQERETDEKLRNRASNSSSIGGAATYNSVLTSLLSVDNINSANINNNRKSTAQNNIPPHSFEAVVYGGTDREVGGAIFDSCSIDSNPVGGINGSEVTVEITPETTEQTETIAFSRPEEQTLEIEFDAVVDDSFVGKDEIKNIIVDYIGGTSVDGEFVQGRAVGENIYTAVLRNHIVSPDETGVYDVNNLVVDKTGNGSDDTTSPNGARILDVSANEVAVVGAGTGDVTINTTTI